MLLGGCGALFAIPVVWNAVAFLGFHVSYDHWPVYFGPQSRFGAFAVGMALAVFAASRRSEPLFRGVWPSVLRVAALVIVLGATALNRPGTYGQVAYHDIAAVGWMLLLASTVLGERGQTWSRWLSWRPLTLAGLISYSTYMWHEPVMMLLGHVGADQPVGGRAAVVDPHRPRRLGPRRRGQLPGHRVPHGQAAGAPRAGRPVANYYPELTSAGNQLTRWAAGRAREILVGMESHRVTRSPASGSSPSAASRGRACTRSQVEAEGLAGDRRKKSPVHLVSSAQPDVESVRANLVVSLTPEELEAGGRLGAAGRVGAAGGHRRSPPAAPGSTPRWRRPAWSRSATRCPGRNCRASAAAAPDSIEPGRLRG